MFPHRTAWLLVLALALFTSGANGEKQDVPLETAARFFEATQAGHCADAFPFYSRGTQENILAIKHREERERDEVPSAETPETHGCYSFRQTRPGTVRLVRQNSDETIVARDYFIGHWSNKYIALGPWAEGTEEIRLIREDGAWRVDAPRLPVGRERLPGERLVEIGRVDVSSFPHNSLDQDVVEATVVSSAPRLEIESVLRDPVSWASLFPLTRWVDVLEDTGGSQRVRLVFTGWDRPVIVTVNTPGEQFDKLRFDAGWNAPLMFTGWWNLSRHPDGTRIRLYLVINKRHWPGDLGERLLAPERLAEAVLGLESAALKR